jgi:hypothetical protein
MKKLSKFASTSNTMNTNVTGARAVNNRASLDSQCSSNALSNKITKSSAFSLVVPPQQLMQQQQQQNNANKNSAFRPVIAASSTTTNQVKLG